MPSENRAFSKPISIR